ncbi:MAG: dTDP-4-dehydrorhamnose reductase, partial [Phenylobacterium sp.]
MTLKVLQFGATGQLSREMLKRAVGDVEIVALSRQQADLTDLAAVERAIGEAEAVDLVLNAAAYTAVDKAESEPELAWLVNGRAPGVMARACAARGLPLVQISTDMVFSGAKAGPYVESDPVGPLHVYGAAKLAGEDAALAAHDRVLVLRVSWLFSAFGQNFLQLMLRLADTLPVLKVVEDQHARPTASGDVAAFILSHAARLAAAPAGAPEWGITHFANAGAANRVEMARAIFELSGRPVPPIDAVPTSALNLPARRALNAELDCTRLAKVFGVSPRHWREPLAEAVAALP